MQTRVKAPKEQPQQDEVFQNLEFTRRADELIGVIKRHCRMIEGRNVEKDETLKIATQIIEERLND